ncbi:MAG: hypothetical protein WBL68_01550 [Nitrososphaeraceae archaeon]
MLSKSMRKKLNEHNWLWIEKQDSNPSQTWQRLKKLSVTAINDLTLLANKLPEDKQEEIFSPNRVEDLIAQIIYIGFFSQSHENFNSRKSEIAARLIKRGIDLSINQYMNSSPETPSLIKPTLDHLNQTVDICSDISYKMKLKNIDEEVEGSEYRYLFSWNNMLTREKNILINFILSKTGDFIAVILKVQNKGDNRRVITFGIDKGDSEIVAQGTFQIAIDNTHTHAEACISDVHHQIIWKDELLVIEVVKDTSLTWRNNLSHNLTNSLDYGNDFNFYIKKNDGPKKRTKQLK